MNGLGIRSGRSILHEEVRAADGTTKFLLQLSDGRVVRRVGWTGGQDTLGVP